ncbi:MAG: acyl-CoA dehydrogenase family protein [Chitinophagales bacterium]|nr:acyl-CoA dehydrogenase family protein [Chitinophagales bacterium]
MVKGCSFIEKAGNYKEAFVPEEFTEEQKMIKKMIIDFCVQEIQEPMTKRGKELYATDENDRKEVERILEKSAELGLCGVAISEKRGGINLDFNTGLIFSEATAQGFSFATTIGAQTSIGSLPIVYYGTEEQKDKYLPGVASAQLKASYCLTEPGAGSDANSGKTKAVLNEAGTHYMLNGQKMWITNGGFADLFIVFAKIDNDEKLSAFIVEKAFGGITLGAEEKKMGIKGSSTVQVFFNDCPVPKENLLGKRQDGFKIALNILNSGRIKLAAGTTGGSKFAINKAVGYALERKQFDTEIANFGVIKDKIATMMVNTFACESAVYQVGRNIDLKTEELKAGGKTESEAKVEALREFAVECSILKVKSSENTNFVLDETIQIFGGMGYSVESGIEMGFRDNRITRIYEGTNEINRMLSVAELTKRHLKTKEINLVTAGKKIPSLLLSNAMPFSEANETKMIANLKAAFLLLSADAGKTLGKKLVDEQEIVMNLSRILAEGYLAEAMYMRYLKLKENKLVSQDKIEAIESMLKVYLYDALEIVRKAGNEIIDAYATGFSKSTNRYLLGLLTKRYNINVKDERRKVAEFAYKQKGYGF